MQSLSALRPREKLENGIYLAVSLAVIFLLFSIIRTPLGWDAAAEGQAIILATPLLAALLYFSRRDEHRAHGIMRKMMLKSKVKLEIFVLEASYLLKIWESTVALGSRPEDEMTNTVRSVIRGNDLRSGIWAERVGTGFRVIMFCMVFSLTIHLVRTLLAGDFLDQRAIILTVSSFILFLVLDLGLLGNWISNRRDETTERGCDLVRFRTLENYMLLAPLRDSMEEIGESDEDTVSTYVANPFLKNLKPEIDGIEMLILRRDWLMFKMRSEGLFKKVEHNAERARDGLLHSHKAVLDQFLDSWKLFIEGGDDELWRSFVYVRHLVMRMNILGLVSSNPLYTILRLEPDEVKDREKYVAVSRHFSGAPDTEKEGAVQSHDAEFIASLYSPEFKKRKIMGSKLFGEKVVTPRREEKKLLQAINDSPDDPDNWIALGAALSGQGRYVEAEEAIRTAIRIAPDNVTAMYDLGIVLRDIKRTMEAIAEFKKVVEFTPKNAAAWRNLGVLLEETGRREEAEEAFRTTTGLRPKSGQSWYNLGVLLGETGRHEEAEEAFRTAIVHKPNFANAWFNLGVLLEETGRHEEAKEAYRTAIVHKPNYAKAWFNLGVLLEETGRHEEAEEAYRTAIRHSPDDSKAWRNLGVLLHKTGRHEEAEEAFRTAIVHKPNYAKAWRNLGVLLEETGRHEEAEEAFRTATGLSPDDGSPDKTEEDAKNDRDSSKQNPTV